MQSLATGRQWEATALTADSPLVKASGAPWPQAADGTLDTGSEPLRQLVTAVRLDDLVAVRLAIGPSGEAEVIWVRPEVSVARGFTLNQAASGESAAVGLARLLAGRMAEGFDKAPELPASTPAPAATATPETPVPAAPTDPTEAPTAPPAPAPGETPPATPTGSEPAPLSTHYQMAEQFLKEGDLRKAEDSAQLASATADPPGLVCLLLARIEAAKRDDDAQRLWLDRALAADPTLAEARLRLADLLRQRGLWQKALTEYQQVLAADPRDRYALLGSANIYAQHDQPRRAADIVNQAVGYYPEDASLHLRLGDLYAAYRALAEAEAAYVRAARLATAAEDKAKALDRLGDLYAAAQRYREGFACYAETSTLRAGGSGALAERRYEQVMVTADEALAKALQAATRAFDGYLAEDGTAREEAYAALADLRGQAQEINAFMDTVVPPASQKLPHARRKLGYSLVLEAAVSAMVHLDTGRADLLEQYQARLREALGTSGLPAGTG
jgi:tetratricopeptide (TPR) repeat protein